ncbi:MAG TPA: hypothetical protein PLZ62_03140 [bacterium]|nr:hypothetical protein [bacterium]
MKKESIFFTLIAIVISCLIGCGGGGGGTTGGAIIITDTPTSTSTPNATITSTPLPGSTATPTSTSTPLPGSTAIPTSTNTPNSGTTTISLHVYDMYSNADIGNANVGFENVSVGTTDASGNVTFNITKAGTVVISDRCITRTFKVDQKSQTIECPVLPTNYNTQFLRAIMGNQPTKKWATKPKFIIFTKVSGKTPVTDVDSALISNVQSVITQIGTLNSFFSGCSVQTENCRPEDYTGITQEDAELYMVEGQNAVTIMFRESFADGGTGYGVAIATSNIITDGGIMIKTTAGLQTIRHEFGHAVFGWDHPSDFIGTGTNEQSIMYPSGTYKASDYSDADKQTIKFIYGRTAGNTAPDTDP